MGSRLAARGGGEPTTQHFFVERRNTAWVPTEEPDTVYLVAVATRATPPPAPIESVLIDSGVTIVSQLEAKTAELHEVNSALSEGIEAVHGLERKVRRLEHDLTESRAQLAAVEGSASWRLIQAIRQRVGTETALGRTLRAVIFRLERLIAGRGPGNPGSDR